MAWCFEDETDTYSDSILAMFAGTDAIVPSIWPLEVANVLLVAERKQRLLESESAQFIRLIGELPITVDDTTSARAVKEIFFVGRQQGLSSYDAAYLELAMREGLGLATRDERLKAAAARCGIKII